LEEPGEEGRLHNVEQNSDVQFLGSEVAERGERIGCERGKGESIESIGNFVAKQVIKQPAERQPQGEDAEDKNRQFEETEFHPEEIVNPAQSGQNPAE
jgi:hypothetical protein